MYYAFLLKVFHEISLLVNKEKLLFLKNTLLYITIIFFNINGRLSLSANYMTTEIFNTRL